MSEYRDELDDHVAESMEDPEYVAAYEAAEERHARLVERPCSEGNCVELYDPETGDPDGGWGPVGCLCQGDPHVPPRLGSLRARLVLWWRRRWTR